MTNPAASGAQAPGAKPHTKWPRVFAFAVAAAVAVGVVVLAFLWPSVTSSAKDFPVAVTGPTAQVKAVEKALTKDGNDTFALTRVDSRAAAVEGIKDRTYDGAIVFSDDAPEVLTASASSPVTTQIMSGVQSNLQKQVDSQLIAGVNAKIAQMQKAGQAAAQEAAQAAAKAAAQAVANGQNPATALPQQGASAGQGQQAAPTIPTVTVKLTDVVPLADTDSRGAGMAAAAFPFTIGGLIGGILISLLVSGTRRRLISVTVYAILAGVAVVAIMQPWMGILQGSFIVNALAAALAFFGTGMFIVGTTALLGGAGIGVGAALTMLVGNPLSSSTAPVQFLPAPWGEIGQWFVPGASSTLLRNLSYFPDANTVQYWLALGAWAVLGLLLSMFGHFRNRELIHHEGWDEEDAASGTPARHVAVDEPVDVGELVATPAGPAPAGS